MSRLFVAATLAMVVPAAMSAPILVSNPQCYDPTGARGDCPGSYAYSDDGGATWAPLDSEVDGAQIQIAHDMTAVQKGDHS